MEVPNNCTSWSSWILVQVIISPDAVIISPDAYTDDSDNDDNLPALVDGDNDDTEETAMDVWEEEM